MEKLYLRAWMLVLSFSLVCLTVVNAEVFRSTVSGLRSLHGQGDSISVGYTEDMGAGTLAIQVEGAKQDVSVGLTKDGVTYNYRLASGEAASLPLNMGDGKYGVEVRVFVRGADAETIWNESIDVRLEDADAPWLSPSKIVNWSDDMGLAKTAASLKRPTDEATALEFCNYIASRCEYNEGSVPLAGYIPDLERVHENGAGVCYDLAALYAGMCRSAGIPCKLVMGYTNYMGDVYHAWCEVNVGGRWEMVDPTYSLDAGVCFIDREGAGITEMKVY